jgi:hypothetical protein
MVEAWGQFGNPGRGTCTVRSHYQRTDEETAADQEDSVRALVNCSVCGFAIVTQ